MAVRLWECESVKKKRGVYRSGYTGDTAMRRVANYAPPRVHRGCAGWEGWESGERGVNHYQSLSMLSSIVNRRQSASIHWHIVLNRLNRNPITFQQKEGIASQSSQSVNAVNRLSHAEQKVKHKLQWICTHIVGYCRHLKPSEPDNDIFLNLFYCFNLSKKCIELSIFSKRLSLTQWLEALTRP